MWTYRNEAIMKGMGWLKKKTNAKTTSCLKWENGRECPLSFFTFKVIPEWLFYLWCVLKYEWGECIGEIAATCNKNKNTKNCRMRECEKTWRRTLNMTKVLAK